MILITELGRYMEMENRFCLFFCFSLPCYESSRKNIVSHPVDSLPSFNLFVFLALASFSCGPITIVIFFHTWVWIFCEFKRGSILAGLRLIATKLWEKSLTMSILFVVDGKKMINPIKKSIANIKGHYQLMFFGDLFESPIFYER